MHDKVSNVMVYEIFTIDTLRIGLTFIMLTYGAYEDIKTREIHDILWLVFGGFGLILSIYEIIIGTLNIYISSISLILILVISLILNYFKLFGQADLIAFIAITVLMPKAPTYLENIWGWSPPLFPFTIISNSAFIGVFSGFYMLWKNLQTSIKGVNLFGRFEDISLLKKLGLVFTGLYIKIEDIREPPFHYPLERVNSEGPALKPDLYNDKEAIETFNNLKENGYEWVWVSISLPYIVIVLLGFLISISIGDLFIWGITFIT